MGVKKYYSFENLFERSKCTQLVDRFDLIQIAQGIQDDIKIFTCRRDKIEVKYFLQYQDYLVKQVLLLLGVLS